jgi:hypothetical protein
LPNTSILPAVPCPSTANVSANAEFSVEEATTGFPRAIFCAMADVAVKNNARQDKNV